VSSAPLKRRGEPAADQGATGAAHAHRRRLYTEAFVIAALGILLVALALANTRRVELDWLVGSTRAPVIWIVLAAALLGWLIGIVTAIAFRRHSRRA